MAKKQARGASREQHGDAVPHQMPPSPSDEAVQPHEGGAVLDRSQGEWRGFWDRYRDTRLAGEVHYSLPLPLLNSLVAEVKGLLTSADVEFEREFSEAASFGVFHGQALGDSANPSAESLALDQSVQAAVQNIQTMLDQDRERIGVDSVDVREAQAHRQKVDGVATSLRRGYVGWLISNAEYRGELAGLLTIASKAIQTRGRFPTRSQLASLLAVEEVAVDALETRLLDFYRRWSLERLLTWDWPQPMHPEFFGSLLHPPETSTQAGISLFLPWSVLQGGRIGDPQLISALKISVVPEHLRDWVLPRSDQATKKAADYFELRTKLYRFYWLALRSRYGDRFRRKLHAIDAAFAGWLGVETDTITRHRLSLFQALQSDETPHANEE